MFWRLLIYAYYSWKPIYWLLKNMILSIVALSLGVTLTINKLAIYKTEQMTGLPYIRTPNLHNTNKVRVGLSLAIGWLTWLIIGMTIYVLISAFCKLEGEK